MANKYNDMLIKSRKKFPIHKRISVRVKKKPTNPFGSLSFAKIIETKEDPDYEIYIHSKYGYLTYQSVSIKNFEAVRLPIDDKLWIELYCVFDVIKVKDPKRDEAWFALMKKNGSLLKRPIFTS